MKGSPMEKKPRISIGLPVYNAEKYLRHALDAILLQTFEDFELIICDNASTDSTAGICASYALADNRIRFYRNDRNLGAAENFAGFIFCQRVQEGFILSHKLNRRQGFAF